ncbi:hypothetical protein [Agrobacterium vitis]|uniref:hypothetical protein n=1 Tax=Agrobacterium vitis TaxID=373 RepID=UPI0008DC22AD|nr:hypothetical protein [Agrobacterium vitis]MUO85558.1 hypothetical protein [Agrobacterium vitis]
MAAHAHSMTRRTAEVRQVSNQTEILALYREWESSLTRSDGAGPAATFEEENLRAELVQKMHRLPVTCPADLAAIILAETMHGTMPLNPRGSLLTAWDLVH